MSRLIDAERFDVVTDTLPEGMDMESYVAGQQSILNMIYDAPTVQETIRCEDCKHRGNDFECPLAPIGLGVPDDFFCAEGEMKNDAAD